MNVILVQEFGILGAAVATSASMFISMGIQYYYLNHIVRFSYPTYKFLWILFSSIVMAIVLKLVITVYPIRSVPTLLTVVLFGVLVHFLLTMTYRSLREMVRNIFLTVIKPS